MQSDFLSAKETKGLKGILAIMVLLSHLSGRVKLFSASILGTMFSAFGYLAVSMFFFLSAYGLYTRYKQSGEGYIKGFLRRKFLPFYGICVCVIAIYVLRDLIFTGTVEWLELAQSFFFGKTVVNFGWYLQTQLVLYVLFWLIFSFVKQNKLLWLSIGTCVYCGVCILMGLTTTWYEAVLCFPMGMICAEHRDKVMSWFQNFKKWLIFVGLGICVFLVTLLLGNKAILPEPIRIFVKVISTLCFSGVIVMTVTRLRVSYAITEFLGKLSLEIYVLQGLLLEGLRPVISNDWLYMGAATVGTILLSVALNPIFSWVSAWVCSKTSPK